MIFLMINEISHYIRKVYIQRDYLPVLNSIILGLYSSKNYHYFYY